MSLRDSNGTFVSIRRWLVRSVVLGALLPGIAAPVGAQVSGDYDGLLPLQVNDGVFCNGADTSQRQEVCVPATLA